MLREVGRGPSLGSHQYGYPQSAGMTVSHHVSCKLNSICPTEPGFFDTFLQCPRVVSLVVPFDGPAYGTFSHYISIRYMLATKQEQKWQTKI
jgi:hypothetical protein